MNSETEQSPFKGWAIVELMGHRRLAGFVSEEEHFGRALLRLDHPDPDPTKGFTSTQLYSPDSLYCLTPTTESVARAVAKGSRPEPVHRWELPAPTHTEPTYCGDTGDDVGAPENSAS